MAWAGPEKSAHYIPFDQGVKWFWDSPYWVDDFVSIVLKDVIIPDRMTIDFTGLNDKKVLHLPSGSFERIIIPLGYVRYIRSVRTNQPLKVKSFQILPQRDESFHFDFHEDSDKLMVQIALGRDLTMNFDGDVSYSARGTDKKEPFYFFDAGRSLSLEDVSSVFALEAVEDKGLIPSIDAGQMVLEESQILWQSPEYGLFQWGVKDDVYVFMFRDYRVQSRFLKRLAFFVEKKGSVGILRSNRYLASRHGYNAHDYKADDLAAFFNLVEEEKFPLNEEELVLKNWLLELGVIQIDSDKYREGKGAIVSASFESYDYLRRFLLTHELFHGLFFTDPLYRDYIRKVWYDLDEDSHRFWSIQLDWRQYDVDNEYLLINEFMAYLMQQPKEDARAYLGPLSVGRVLSSRPYLNGFLNQYLRDNPTIFVDTSQLIEEFTIPQYGIKSGEMRIFIKN
ncbi:hypothetical protein [Spirochaeta cellobiosiphila]|uniref:hypothetical protein n=1 Tax=Spirochaeta cellobiosiphila TaxID=504483 RepID=UPI000409C84B|nr:hypothetical protein [Spirochaeta cellobiosiphila]